MKRIVVIDNHPVMREGLQMVIDLETTLEVCGSGGTVDEALDLVAQTEPDLVLTDLTLSERSGIDLIKELRQRDPELPVLVISMHDELVYAERVLRAGGRGYISKESSMEVLIDAIHRVLGGGIYVSESVACSFLHGVRPNARPETSFPLQRLTKREIQIFELIGRAWSNQQIADALKIDPRTVDAHRIHIREKLGLPDGNALTRFAIRWTEVGLIHA